LIINNNFENVKFWRTQNKNEVDFIIEESKNAYEVKFNTKRFNVKEYKLFKNTYPKFDLQVIDLEKSLELLMK
jgi:predicted AAA+ superfamily ATPase